MNDPAVTSAPEFAKADGRTPVQPGPWHAIRICIAGLTVLWAFAWTLVTLFYISNVDSGPPGHGGIGSLMAAGFLLMLWIATGLAAGFPRIGGVILACFGVLVWIALPEPITRWGLAVPAVALGLIAVVSSVMSRRPTTRA